VDKKLLLSKIETSKQEVAEAEGHLMKVLGDTRSAPRAPKTTITETVSEAIAKLRAARNDLEDIAKLVAADDD
jgi:hypothetical protein